LLTDFLSGISWVLKSNGSGFNELAVVAVYFRFKEWNYSGFYSGREIPPGVFIKTQFAGSVSCNKKKPTPGPLQLLINERIATVADRETESHGSMFS